MSDTGRQSFTEKTTSAMKPDSQKSITEQASDKVKGTMDSAASTLQPSSQKSDSQAMGDTVSGNKNDNQESLLGKAKSAMGMGEGNP